VLVISGAIPIDLLAVESANIRAGSTGVAAAESLRKRFRELTIAKWQERWVNSSKGRSTYKLIPELQRWLGRKHGHVDFYLTQLLTGHECFKYYLNRFRHEHVFCVCPRFENERRDVSIRVGRTPAACNLVDIMLESEVNWSAVCNMATIVLKKKNCASQKDCEIPIG